MNLEQPTQDNLKYMLDELTSILGVANKKLFDATDYNLDKYEDLKFLYQHVSQTGSLSPQETDAFIKELGALRK